MDEHGLAVPARRVPIPGDVQSVDDVLGRAARLWPDAEALVGRRVRYTYAELDAEVDRAAGALARLGLGPGDRLAACLPNRPEIVVAFLAAMRQGAIWVGVNRVLAPPEKAHILADAQATLLLAEP
ncbi:MAG: AMP-binding protein, partial [Acidimicrobiales bacterium]